MLKVGTISKIIGLDDLADDDRIVANVQRFYIGDSVLPEWIGTEKQVFTRLYIVCDSKEKLKEAIEEYREKISVFDESGNNMLLNGFDCRIVLK